MDESSHAFTTASVNLAVNMDVKDGLWWWWYLLIHREGTPQHEEHEADGPSKGQADESYKRRGDRVRGR